MEGSTGGRRRWMRRAVTTPVMGGGGGGEDNVDTMSSSSGQIAFPFSRVYVSRDLAADIYMTYIRDGFPRHVR